MLEFNPYFRITAEKALQSKIFDKIRLKQYEKPTTEKIKLEIYKDDFFDYTDGSSTKIKGNADFKKMLAKEVKKVRKNSILYA